MSCLRIGVTGRFHTDTSHAVLIVDGSHRILDKNRKYPVVYPEKIEPFKLFSILVKGTVIATNPLYQLDFIHAAKDYARMKIQGSYFSVSIGSMQTKVAEDTRKEQLSLNIPADSARREWSIIFHVDGSTGEIECPFDDKEVLKGEKFPLSDFRIWEHFNAAVQVEEMLITSGIPHPVYITHTDSAPFMKAFVRLQIGDGATIIGDHKDGAGIRVLNTSQEVILSGCPAGEATVKVERNSHGCTFSAAQCGKTVQVSKDHLVLHFDAFIPLFSPNFVIRNVKVSTIRACERSGMHLYWSSWNSFCKKEEPIDYAATRCYHIYEMTQQSYSKGWTGFRGYFIYASA